MTGRVDRPDRALAELTRLRNLDPVREKRELRSTQLILNRKNRYFAETIDYTVGIHPEILYIHFRP